MIQNELDYTGSGCNVNVKAINPNINDGSGIYTLSYLQSITKSLAFGGELIGQKGVGGEAFETGVNLVTRWAEYDDMPAEPIAASATADKNTVPKPKTIATLTLQQFVALQASYFHRVSEKVELATEWQALLVGPRSDSVTSVSAKFDLRQACVRAQLDSQGKVSVVYEERLLPGFSLLLSGELDHFRGSSRFGIGLNMEN